MKLIQILEPGDVLQKGDLVWTSEYQAWVPINQDLYGKRNKFARPVKRSAALTELASQPTIPLASTRCLLEVGTEISFADGSEGRVDAYLYKPGTTSHGLKDLGEIEITVVRTKPNKKEQEEMNKQSPDADKGSCAGYASTSAEEKLFAAAQSLEQLQDKQKKVTMDDIFPPEEKLFAGGKVASSHCPPYHLIPTVALDALANVCALGLERKKDKAWNAISKNQEVLYNEEFVLERLSHVIAHAMKLRDQIAHGVKEGDESPQLNAAAVMWGGSFLVCAMNVK